MWNGNPAILRLIRAEIKTRGPVSFAWFMQQVLYHPEYGYYSSGRCAIGRRGDYFTNVSVGPLFGHLLAVQFAEIWHRLGKPYNFAIVEQGAHHGDFARDVLESARKHWSDFFAALRYKIVEPFSILQGRQSQTLQAFRDKLEWYDSIDALQPFTGVHFSNELLDAMPVRLIAGGIEKLVDFDGKNLLFVERSVHDSEKFNQAALDWVENLAAKLQSGYILAVDYGKPQSKSQATIQVRAQHRYLDSPFDGIGYADITAHVDWTSIARCAERRGLRLAGFTDQHHFLPESFPNGRVWRRISEQKRSAHCKRSFIRKCWVEVSRYSLLEKVWLLRRRSQVLNSRKILIKHSAFNDAQKFSKTMALQPCESEKGRTCHHAKIARYMPSHLGTGMRPSIARILFVLQALSAVACASNSVVNLSHYDLVQPDFAAMKSEGILGVIHEATYPRLEIDPRYFQRQQTATRAGLLWGAYHYANASDPVRQADHFLSVVSNACAQADPLSRPSRVLLVLDFEKNGHYPGGTMRADQAVAFVQRIHERTGKYPGIYSGEYFLWQTLHNPKVSVADKMVLAKCWLWLANYSTPPRTTSPWESWNLWQYCGDGRCKLPRSAYPKSVANIIKAERNIFNGTSTALQTFWQEHGWQPGEKSRREPERMVTADL